MVRLQLLGNFQLEHNGRTIYTGRRKCQALLAYLAMSGRRQSREFLASLLWPDTDASKGAAYLRNALWVLNRTALKPFLNLENNYVTLKPGPELVIDASHFLSCISAAVISPNQGPGLHPECLQHLETAVSIYCGPFLNGFALQDSPEFEHWQYLEAENLQQEYIRVLNRITDHYQYTSQWEMVLRTAQKMISADPLDEAAHRRMISAYAQLDQKASAASQFELCQKLLRDELGMDPEPETIELMEQIRAGKFPRTRPAAAPGAVNIPVFSTPFIGRQNLLNRIEELLTTAPCRLLTITGMGGSGKTRLAHQSVKRLLPHFIDGIVWVSLAPVTADNMILPAILTAADIHASNRFISTTNRSNAAIDRLASYLSVKNMLLVLDNTEHLKQAPAVAASILNSAPGVKILVTSRQRLNLQSEWVLEVNGLSYPDGNDMSDFQNWDAVKLFLLAAERASGTASFLGSYVQDIMTICRILKGFPLALELAAVWTKVISYEDIVREIQTNLDFLSTPLKDVPERHKSLRAVFNHSWHLLSETEQSSFRQISIFQGGFGRHAAREIAGASITSLAALVDKSILIRTAQDRFEMHELLRQYAQEMLSNRPDEMTAIQTRHAKHYLKLVNFLETSLKDSRQKSAISAIQDDIQNIRTAWICAANTRNYPAIRQAMLSLFLYYDIRSHFQEGVEDVQPVGSGDPGPGSCSRRGGNRCRPKTNHHGFHRCRTSLVSPLYGPCIRPVPLDQ